MLALAVALCWSLVQAGHWALLSLANSPKKDETSSSTTTCPPNKPSLQYANILHLRPKAKQSAALCER